MITTNQLLAGLAFTSAVGLGGLAAHREITDESTTKLQTAATAGHAAGMAGLGTALLVPNSSRLMLPALGVALLGISTYAGAAMLASRD